MLVDDFKEQADDYKVRYHKDILKVESATAVQAAVSYAAVLNKWGLNSENYPLFLEVLEVPNTWVVDRLTVDCDLENFLEPVIPSYFIVDWVLEILDRHQPRGLYPKVLTVLLGFLYKVYRNPREGYGLYDIDSNDVNAIGKHLDESKPQDSLPNRVILDVLKFVNELDFDGVAEAQYDAAKQAGLIRSHFFDSTQNLSQCLPAVLLTPDTELNDGLKPEFVYQ